MDEPPGREVQQGCTILVDGVFVCVASFLKARGMVALLTSCSTAHRLSMLPPVQRKWQLRCERQWRFVRIAAPRDGNWLRLYGMRRRSTLRRRASFFARMDSDLELQREELCRRGVTEGVPRGEIDAEEHALLQRAEHERRKSTMLMRSFMVYRGGPGLHDTDGNGRSGRGGRGGRGGRRGRRHSVG